MGVCKCSRSICCEIFAEVYKCKTVGIYRALLLFNCFSFFLYLLYVRDKPLFCNLFSAFCCQELQVIVFGSIVSIAFSVFKTNLGLVSSIFFALTNIIWAGLSYSMSVFKYSEFLLVIMPLVLSILGILLWMLYVKRSAKKKA